MLGVLLAAIHFTGQLQDQTELQVLGVSGATATTWNFATTPSVDLTAAWGRWTLGLQYALVVTGRTLEQSPSVDLLQRGDFGLIWRGRRWRVAIDERASYGTVNYASAATSAPTPALQALPMNTTLFTASSWSSLTLSARLTRRLEGAIYGGWSLSGGVDAAARAVVPLQSGPIGGARANYTLSQQDWLEGTLDFTRVQFSETACTSSPTLVGVTSTARCTPRDDLAMLQLGLRHRFTRTTEATLRAGAAVVGTHGSVGAPYLLRAEPLVGATISHRTRDVNAETVYRLGAQLSPIVAQQTGAIDRRLQGDASVEWTSQRLILRASARASQSIPFDVSGAYLVANMETSVGVRFDRYLTVSLGERIDWQRYASGQSLVAVLGFLRVQVASRRIQF